MAIPGQSLEWNQVHAGTRSAVMRWTMLRPLVTGALASVFIAIALVSLRPTLCAMAVVAGVVFAAFAREAWSNYGDDPLVLLGRVTQAGGVWEKDSGEQLESPALRVTYVRRITVEVAQAFQVSRTGEKKARPDLHGKREYDQPWWVKQVEVGEEVALACLPKTTDPVLKLDRSRLG